MTESVTPESCHTQSGTVPTDAEDPTEPVADANVDEVSVTMSPPAEMITATAAKNRLLLIVRDILVTQLRLLRSMWWLLLVL